jgi:hypothetical protein
MTEIDKSAIIDAYDQLVQDRKKHWIGGVADKNEIRGIVRDVAHFFGIPKDTVAAQVKGRSEVVSAQ